MTRRKRKSPPKPRLAPTPVKPQLATQEGNTTADGLPCPPAQAVAQEAQLHSNATPVVQGSVCLPILQSEQELAPISSKVLFWRPRYLAQSQCLQHVPFYFWLTEVLQPNVVVEPNLNSAVGYFAICQAMDKLNQDGLAYAAFGAHCDIEAVSRYNHEHYREFSQLATTDESAFVSEFDDASIDLLLLKQESPLFVGESGQAGLSPLLQRKLSAHAVVLIHGSMASEHRNLCIALRSRYPSFELAQPNGLLLLCMGKAIPAQLEILIQQSQDVRAQRLIQNIFARLGSANEDAWQCRVYEQQLHGLSEQREEKQWLVQEKARLEQELSTLKQGEQQAFAEQARLQQDIDVRFEELAKLTQLLVDTEARLETAQRDNQLLRQQLSETQCELEKLKTTSKQGGAKAQADLTKVRDELTKTQAALSQAQHEQAQALAEKTQALTELAAATAELATTQAELHKQRELAVLLERDQQVAADKISTLAGSELALQQSLNERFDELATLTNLLQQKEQQYEATLSQLQATQSRLNKQQQAAVTGKIKNRFETAKQRRAKAKQFALDVDLLRQSELFDEAWYLKQHPEAAKHKLGAAGHYLEKGVALGANPSAAFDGNWYLNTHQDVKDAGMNPLFHYLKFGHKESRLLKHF